MRLSTQICRRTDWWRLQRSKKPEIEPPNGDIFHTRQRVILPLDGAGGVYCALISPPRL
jgi:hypothetical protein